jgi:hypothetical protein
MSESTGMEDPIQIVLEQSIPSGVRKSSLRRDSDDTYRRKSSLKRRDSDPRRTSNPRKISWRNNLDDVVGQADDDYDRTPIEVTPMCSSRGGSSTGAFGFTKLQLFILFVIWILYVLSLLTAVLYFNGYFNRR